MFSTGDGLDHYRRLIAGAGRPPAADGGVLIQFDGNVLEAERSELPWLARRLESLVAAAAYADGDDAALPGRRDRLLCGCATRDGDYTRWRTL